MLTVTLHSDTLTMARATMNVQMEPILPTPMSYVQHALRTASLVVEHPTLAPPALPAITSAQLVSQYALLAISATPLHYNV